jgi:hypothetical protein
MGAPKTSVKIAFDLAAGGGGDFLTLDDPVKGVLSGGTVVSDYPLAGETLEDVTDYVRAVSINRGRSQDLAIVESGALNVLLDNRARTFDPTAGTAVSPYSAGIKPRKQIVVEMNGVQQFNGSIEDWDLRYDLSSDSVAIAKASDGFTVLAQQAISPHLATAQTTGERVEAILDRPEIGWPAAKRNIDTGVASLIADNIGGTATPVSVNALQYLQQVERDESGALFIAKDGSLTFRERLDLQQSTSIRFADDGSGIPFTDIEVVFGMEQLRNSIQITRLNAGTVTAEYPQSIADFGIVVYEIRDSLLADDAEASELANWLLTLYGQPVLRVSTLAVVMDGLSAADQDSVLSLEIGDVVNVTFTPNGVGSPIDRSVVIDKIQHEVTPGVHRVQFGLSATLGAFILDSATFGVLDSNTLGF